MWFEVGLCCVVEPNAVYRTNECWQGRAGRSLWYARGFLMARCFRARACVHVHVCVSVYACVRVCVRVCESVLRPMVCQTYQRGDAVWTAGEHAHAMLLVLDGTLVTETGRDKFRALVRYFVDMPWWSTVSSSLINPLGLLSASVWCASWCALSAPPLS